MTESYCPDGDQLIAYFEGTLDETSADALAEHLEVCADCDRAMCELEDSWGTLFRGMALAEPAEMDGYQSAMQRLLDADAAASTCGLPADDDDDEMLASVGHYQVLGRLGRGGMGAVYRALDTRLNRIVALKLPRHLRIANAETRARLIREAQAAAALRHVNICPIYEVGEASGQPYIAMAHIEGQLLSEWSAAGRSSREIADVMATLSDAVAYAHSKGIVHRDLKPGNVMIDTEARAPMLMDFGLAVDVRRQSARTTQDGDVLGTPAYMSPEQAAGRVRDVGPASDIYALGAILYELLAGHVPFQGAVGEVLAKVQHEEPPSLRQSATRIHRDLETIVLKCMAKDPKMRYPSAAALSEDLQRFGAGEPILARRAHPVVRWANRVKRRPVALLAVVAVATVALVAGYFASRMDQVRESNELLEQINTVLDEPELAPGDAQLAQSRIDRLEALSPNQAQRARERLANSLVRAVQTRLRAPRIEASDVQVVDALLNELVRLPTSRLDGLQARRDARFRAWQLEMEAAPPIAEIPAGMNARSVELDGHGGLSLKPGVAPPSGSLSVLTGWESSGNSRMDVAFEGAWKPGQSLGLLMHCDGGQPGPITCLAAAPGGQRIAAGNEAGFLAVWNTRTRREEASLRAHPTAVQQLKFSPTGEWLATSGSDGTVRVWRISDWRKHAEFSTGNLASRTAYPPPLAFSPDGRWLASRIDGAVNGSDIVIWEVETKARLARLQGHNDVVTALAFHPSDASRLASASVDSSVRVWDVPNQDAMATLRVQKEAYDRVWDALVSVSFLDDGDTIIAGRVDEHLFQWDLAAKELVASRDTAAVGVGRDGLNDILVSPNRRLAAMRHRPQLDVWQIESHRGGDANWRCLWTVNQGPHCFVADQFLAVGTSTGRIQLWGLESGRLHDSLGGKSLAFLLRSLPDPSSESTDSPVELGGAVEVSILRNGLLLRQATASLDRGAIRLSVERKNELLSIQVNDSDPLKFSDLLPAQRPHEGFYGVVWPAEARVKRLAAFQQPLPAASSSLELGDELYAAGKYAAAEVEYQRQSQTSGSQTVRREAECKSALCWLAQGRREQGAAALIQLCQVGGQRDRWTTISLFQLWLLKVRQRAFGEASDFAERLMRNHDASLLSEFVASHMRRQILDAYAPLLEPSYGAARYDSARHLLALYEAAETLPVSPAEKEAIGLRLIASLRGTRQAPHARQIAQSLRENAAADWPQRVLRQLPRVDELQARLYPAHVMGAEAACLRDVDQLLFGSNREQVEWRLEQTPQELTRHLSEERRLRPGVMPAGCTLFLERSRILARVGRWRDARESLAEFHRFARLIFLSYQQYAAAQLLDGFAHQAKGDVERARDSWRLARWNSWQTNYLQGPAAPPHETDDRMLDLLAASLARELTSADARAAWESMCQAAGVGELSKAVGLYGDFGEDELVDLWMTAAGDSFARRYAYGELRSAEQLRGGIELVLAAVIAKGCPGAAIAHERLIHDTVTDMFALVRTGRVKPNQLRELLAVWRGSLHGTEWQSSKPLAAFPRQRAQVAYLLGMRMLRVFGRANDATVLLQTAIEASAPAAMVRQLATAELERMR